MWRGEVRRGRAGQAFNFGEPGVLDGATAKSLAVPRRTVGHDRLARSSRRSPSGGVACGFWIRAWSHASPLFKQPAA